MKLAEALQERADLNKKIQQLQQRINNNVLVQEGEKSQEDPQALIKELDGAIARLEKLMADINLTNCQTEADGKTLTELIARKDALSMNLFKSGVEDFSESVFDILTSSYRQDLKDKVDQMHKNKMKKLAKLE